MVEYTSILPYVFKAWWLNNLAQRQFYLYLSVEDFEYYVGLHICFLIKYLTTCSHYIAYVEYEAEHSGSAV
jgi:hypothetical protein